MSFIPTNEEPKAKSNKGISINRGLVCNDKITSGEEKVKEMLQRKINKWKFEKYN